MVKLLKNLFFVLCLSVLISKNVYTPVLVQVSPQSPAPAAFFEIA